MGDDRFDVEAERIADAREVPGGGRPIAPADDADDAAFDPFDIEAIRADRRINDSLSLDGVVMSAD